MLIFAELADQAGLARPSVYEYFRSKGELIIALVDDEFPAWRRELDAAVGGAVGAEARIETFVRTMLRLVAAGRHHLPFAFAASEFHNDIRAHVVGRHAELLALLRPSLAELGVGDVDACSRFVNGVLVAAIEHLRAGAAAHVVDDAVPFVLGGVRVQRERCGGPEAPKAAGAKTSGGGHAHGPHRSPPHRR